MTRTITDKEITLIKAMLTRGMKNTDIQFFFNRPGRPVNSGRISTIADGTYSDSARILAASDDELNVFLASHSPAADMPPVVIASGTETPHALSQTTLVSMFMRDVAGAWRLKDGETDQAECKTSFGMKHPAAWLRAVAALANNRGGYVFFGVSDKDSEGACKVVGLANNDFAQTDPGEIAKRLRSTFDPTPRFQKALISVGGRTVGVLHVERHPSRPVIATKNDGGSGEIKEGDIFHRYPGSSTRISYGDLRSMLDERDAHARAEILPMVQRLLKLGPDRAMVADLADGRLIDGKTSIELSEDTIERLTLIKEGELDEKAGAPALHLIGSVKAATPVTVRKGILTRADMRQAFLEDSLHAEPLDYVRVAVEISGNDWLPIRYFARKAGMSLADLRTFIDQTPGASAQKKLCKQRLSSPDKAYVQAKGPALTMGARFEAGEEIMPENGPTARLVALAIQGLPRPLTIEPAPLRAALVRCLGLLADGKDQLAKTVTRKGIARLDELMSPW